jgi:hypothetical protein
LLHEIGDLFRCPGLSRERPSKHLCIDDFACFERQIELAEVICTNHHDSAAIRVLRVLGRTIAHTKVDVDTDVDIPPPQLDPHIQIEAILHQEDFAHQALVNQLSHMRAVDLDDLGAASQRVINGCVDDYPCSGTLLGVIPRQLPGFLGRLHT